MALNILVVDDASLSREAIASFLNELGHRAEAHANAFTALESLENGCWELVLTDLRMPSMDGLQFLKEIKARSPDTAVIIMTAYGTVETAVEAIRAGAMDYVVKPFHTEQLRLHIERLNELLRARQELAALRKTVGASYAGLVGNSPEMQKIHQLIGQFANRPANVLITGETGTGKEMVARALHAQSSRKDGPFIPIACAAVPRDLAESELFGHEAGAFTGAVKRRHGHVEQAHGGTLFLDDVDDLPLDIQPKLLRAIQEREFQRVGGERLLKTDLRVISSSKKDLEALSHEGRFRQDLLYRLQVLALYVPPLRERKGDILVLARHFLDFGAQETGEVPKVLSEEAQQKLVSHSWPGNVRELRHAIEYATAVSTGPVIQAEDLQLRLIPGHCWLASPDLTRSSAASGSAASCVPTKARTEAAWRPRPPSIICRTRGASGAPSTTPSAAAANRTGSAAAKRRACAAPPSLGSRGSSPGPWP
jgi:DNA-binding NtrC family response regulator